ncbi:unnamed protein product [Dovyalis caffra]|uniref:Uncharacterized protein n=1 Tax=Dovyalis caffra TaxID=77055 RepID=A0AAV1SRY9_9ROSI|nr:unnamed protein product [Dovyalis caffra]
MVQSTNVHLLTTVPFAFISGYLHLRPQAEQTQIPELLYSRSIKSAYIMVNGVAGARVTPTLYLLAPYMLFKLVEASDTPVVGGTAVLVTSMVVHAYVTSSLVAAKNLTLVIQE